MLSVDALHGKVVLKLCANYENGKQCKFLLISLQSLVLRRFNKKYYHVTDLLL